MLTWTVIVPRSDTAGTPSSVAVLVTFSAVKLSGPGVPPGVAGVWRISAMASDVSVSAMPMLSTALRSSVPSKIPSPLKSGTPMPTNTFASLIADPQQADLDLRGRADRRDQDRIALLQRELAGDVDEVGDPDPHGARDEQDPAGEVDLDLVDPFAADERILGIVVLGVLAEHAVAVDVQRRAPVERVGRRRAAGGLVDLQLDRVGDEDEVLGQADELGAGEVRGDRGPGARVGRRRAPGAAGLAFSVATKSVPESSEKPTPLTPMKRLPSGVWAGLISIAMVSSCASVRSAVPSPSRSASTVSWRTVTFTVPTTKPNASNVAVACEVEGLVVEADDVGVAVEVDDLELDRVAVAVDEGGRPVERLGFDRAVDA